MQVARRKYMAKRRFDVQKKAILGEINDFSPQFYHKWTIKPCCAIIRISVAVSFFYRSQNESVWTNFSLPQDKT